jgi:cell division transport system ATP-binding protein
LIQARNVSKSYARGVQALRDVSLAVEKGEFVFLTGPSGAGKSTLLRLLLCQERPTSGDLTVAGRQLASLSPREVQDYRRTIGFVFQDFKLVPRRTVYENVAMVLRATGTPEHVERRRTMQALQGVGLQHRTESFPLELSGGEQQRVAVARALVNNPVLVFADEPTGNLDPDLALDIMNLFREMNARGTTVLIATHDRELIHRVGRRTIALEHGHLVDGAATA